MINLSARIGKILEILADYFDIEPKVYRLYHSSPASNLNSILSNGLVPGQRDIPTDKPWVKELVWMGDDPEIAKHHGLRQMEKKQIPGDLVVFEINFDAGQKKLFKALQKGFYTCPEAIPPEWISVYETVNQGNKTGDYHEREWLPGEGPRYRNQKYLCYNCGCEWSVPLYKSYGTWFFADDEPEECPECGSEDIEEVV